MLPEETISRIISDIESYEPLKNLALCSSQFHRITVPYLYSHVCLRDDGSSQLEEHLYKNTPSFIHLRNITVLLLRTPEYAQHVRRFTMREQFQTGSDIKIWEEIYERDDVVWEEIDEVLKEAIKTYSHSKEEEALWLRDVAEDRHEDALLALLLPALVKLKCLDLAMAAGANYFARLIKRVGRKEKPFDSSPSLSALTDIMNTVSDEEYGMAPSYFALYFDLPAVRSIYSHRLASANDEDDNAPPELELAALDPGTSSVTHLELKDCKLHRTDIIRTLRSPKALTTFIYELGIGLSYCGHNLPAILSGLETHKHSLENLWLDHPNGDEWRTDGDGMDDMTPIAFFANFQVLRNVRIGTGFIFGEDDRKDFGDEERREVRRRLVEGLPPSIEMLRITHCADQFLRVLSAVEGLLEQKEKRFVYLKAIALEAPWSFMAEFWDRADTLLYLADTNGVRFTAMNDNTIAGPCYSPGWPERAWGMEEDIYWAHGFNGLNTREVMKVVDIRRSRICS
ncbi:hypothetical protein FIBSPDRAFT_1043291 [Athelia psychrophila]|uniref:F-box domain-containing protein n=1 Tax=Athelia psychrophila TaxID=1759441 RepID=A0A166LGW5_9AGAM|nr:hypothetical protein FIBSPDRAFT_1043291 [Fibularhizoctonia sp. CBS 109695]